MIRHRKEKLMKKALPLIVILWIFLGITGCVRSEHEPNDTLPPEETTATVTTDFNAENDLPETDETDVEVTSVEPDTDDTGSEITSVEPETSETDEIPVYVPVDETWCYIHSLEFHSFTDALIDYVGNDELMSWIEGGYARTSEIENCPFHCNIYNFIKEFEVPREVFEASYYGTADYYWDDHNIDLLYGDDMEAVNEYYTSHSDREEEREKYSSLGEIKFGIDGYAMMSSDEKMQEFFETYCKNNAIVDWSIADFVKATGIEKGDLQALIEDITVREYPGETVILNCFDFDYDALYDIAASKTADSDKEATVIDKHNEDLVFCRQPPLEIVLTYEIRRDS